MGTSLRALLSALIVCAASASAEEAKKAAEVAPPALELPDISWAPASRSASGDAPKKAPAKPSAPNGVAATVDALPGLTLPPAPAPAPAKSAKRRQPPGHGAAASRQPAETIVAPAPLVLPGTAPAPAAAARAVPASTAPASAPAPLAARAPAARLAGASDAQPEQADLREDRHGFFATLRLGLLIPSGRPSDAYAAAGAPVPTAKRGATVPVTLQLGYRLPWLSRDLAVTVEGGWYPLSAQGSRAFPQDPDFANLAYSWTATQIPLFAGLEYRLPFLLPGAFERLSFSAGASFAAVWTKATATYSAEGVTDSPQSGWAKGFALDAGVALRLGPGQLTFDARYVSARTDLRLQSFYPGQPWNAQKGDVQGANYLFGYRISL